MSPRRPGYQEVVALVYGWATHLATIDLERLIGEIDHAQQIGPLVDPALYREARRALKEDREVLEAVRALRAIGARITAARH